MCVWYPQQVGNTLPYLWLLNPHYCTSSVVRLHSPATGRPQILELKITKLILTKKLEASLLARSEDWQQHFRAAPQGATGAQPGLSARGAAPRCPQSTAGPATADRVSPAMTRPLQMCQSCSSAVSGSIFPSAAPHTALLLLRCCRSTSETLLQGCLSK